MKAFFEALQDGFEHITEITDPTMLQELRADGILIDDEGYYSYTFGPEKEFELCIEPILSDNMYCIALYKNRVLLTEKIMVKALTREEIEKD